MSATLLQAAGLSIEIIGAAFLASAFLAGVRPTRAPIMFVRAIFQPRKARAFVSVAPGEKDRLLERLNGLRGAALLWVGFLLQLAGVLTHSST